MNVPDPAARMDDSIVQRKLSLVAGYSLDQFRDCGLIIRMDALEKCFESRWSLLRIETQHAEALFGPVPDLARGRGPCPTARVAQPLRLRQVGFALAQVILRLLALGQIEHEGDALVSASAEGRRAEKDGHAGTVFPEVLLLERFAASRRPELCHGPFVSATPFDGRQLRPEQVTRNEIVAAVS